MRITVKGSTSTEFDDRFRTRITVEIGNLDARHLTREGHGDIVAGYLLNGRLGDFLDRERQSCPGRTSGHTGHDDISQLLGRILKNNLQGRAIHHNLLSRIAKGGHNQNSAFA